MRFFIAVASACVLLSACSTTPEKAPPPPSKPQAVAPVPPPPPVAAETVTQRQDRLMKALTEKSVYFDYDDYSIKTQYQDLLRQDYEFLNSAPQVSVTLQGNADERGSTEYNLALGQKRAESVKRALKLMGVPEDRLEAISFGKEKPRTLCHEEKCWAENRRVDLAFRKATTTK